MSNRNKLLRKRLQMHDDGRITVGDDGPVLKVRDVVSFAGRDPVVLIEINGELGYFHGSVFCALSVDARQCATVRWHPENVRGGK